MAGPISIDELGAYGTYDYLSDLELRRKERRSAILTLLNEGNNIWYRKLIESESSLFNLSDKLITDLNNPDNDAETEAFLLGVLEYNKLTPSPSIRKAPILFKAEDVNKMIEQDTEAILRKVDQANRDMGLTSNVSEDPKWQAWAEDKVYAYFYYKTSMDPEALDIVVGEIPRVPSDEKNAIVENIAIDHMNLRSLELVYDPTVPLVEHKLRQVFIQGATDETDVFNKALSAALTGQMEGLDPERVDDEIAAYMINNPDGLNQVIERAKTQTILHHENWLNDRTSSGDWTIAIGNSVDENPFTYFGPFTSEPALMNVVSQKFIADKAYRDKELMKWLTDLDPSSRNFAKPSDAIDPLTGEIYDPEEVTALRQVNEQLKDTVEVLLFGDSKNEVIGYMDKNGNFSASVLQEAKVKGVPPEAYITDEIYSYTSQFITPDSETGISVYDSLLNQKALQKRNYNYRKNPATVTTDLKNALRYTNNGQYWVDGEPVTQSRVSDAQWAAWEQSWVANGPDTALQMIEGELSDAVEVQQFGAMFGTEAGRRSAITRQAVKQGIITEDTSPEYLRYFTNNVIPRMSQKSSYSGATDFAEFEDKIGGYIKNLPAYERFESDFRRQFMSSSKTPHAIPRDFTDPATGKTYQLPEFTVGAPKELEFEFDPAFSTDEVLKMAEERPEFARFLAQEMKDPDFMEAWRKASQPIFDAEKFETLRSGAIDPETGERVGGIAEKAAAELQKTEEELEPYKRFGQYAPGSVSEDVTKLEEQKKQQEFFAGAGFAKQAKFESMTPGQTTEEFFAGQLPGFEQRYKDSAFFKQEEARLEQERKRDQALRKQTRAQEERERRALLRGGTGQGRGLSVFRRRE